MSISKYVFFILALFCALPGEAQEYAVPLRDHTYMHAAGSQNVERVLQKPTALSLPFFDDFTDEGYVPSAARWMDTFVFINNTMAIGIRSRGCATFDALNQFGIPYDTMAPYHQVWADSLTSREIDLSSYQASDSIYLSFLYQPGGAGFAPKPADSLMVYFRRGDGGWQQVWSMPGDSLSGFNTAMVAVKDTSFFHSDFQFRFLNKATHGISNSNWNVDYVRMDKNRNDQDSLIRDVAYTRQPGNLLADFTAMPFRQFKANPASFLNSNVSAWLRNNGSLPTTLQYGRTTNELTTGIYIGSQTGNAFFQPGQEQEVSMAGPDIAGFQQSDPTATYIFRSRYFVSPVYPNEPTANDTIIQDQVFGNYFAYDDGSAEQAYFLHLYPSAPGKLAEEFALYTPDTLRGIDIFFPRQVPTAAQKEFSIVVYQTIAINGAQDQILYEENYLTPRYASTPGGFVTYAFAQPVSLPEGTFYIAIVQAAGGGSDSLYVGLDVSRQGVNHRYFNVDGTWQNSLIEGALLLRPLVGAPLPPSGISVVNDSMVWTFGPNPARKSIHVVLPVHEAQSTLYQILDLQGRIVQSGMLVAGGMLSVQSLPSGIYFIRLGTATGFGKPKKLIKM